MNTTSRNLLAAFIGALSATVLYLGVAELIYHWYEVSLSDRSDGLVVAGLLLALISLPGHFIGGYGHTEFWINYFGHSHQTSADYARRYIEFHVPMFTTAALLFVVMSSVLVIFVITGSVMNRHGERFMR